MRRIVAIAGVLAASVAALAVSSPSSDDGGAYQVRAIFGNGDFMAPGEDVRIAGAIVGSVKSVDVTGTDEEAHQDGSPDPGNAVVVLQIDDPGFQDFRQDASCLIRPQSLLGEKFVECESTQPRAPGTQPPPPLDVIGDGEPGAGERLLPIEQTGTAVDLDLVQNIMREPYADRFRLIINDLGAGLAARGEDLNAIIRSSNPALEKTDEVLGILAHQNHELANLATDSDQVLAPLARERQHITGFINNAQVAAQATAQRSADLERGIHRLPDFLRQLSTTMQALQSFSDRTRPVFSDLAGAAPDLTRITRGLGPFARAGTPALTSLGNAADVAGPALVDSQPLLRDLNGLAHATGSPSRHLEALLRSLRERASAEIPGQPRPLSGDQNLVRLLFNATGSVNSFDEMGHFQRALLPLNNCVDYKLNPEAGCDANFNRPLGKSAAINAAGGISFQAAGLDGANAKPRKAAGGVRPEQAKSLLDFLFGKPPAPYAGDGVTPTAPETTTTTTTPSTTEDTTPSTGDTP